MYKCDECGGEYETWQAKANHVRWKHKPTQYTEDGLRRLRESVKQTNNRIHGPKSEVTEDRTCLCGKKFSVTFSPERRTYIRKTCSKECASRHPQTQETNDKRSRKLKELFRTNPESFENWMRAGYDAKGSRFSSKAERALGEALRPYGYRRHQLIKTGDIKFDVDIVSEDMTVWVESDGEYHFRKVHEGHNFDATRLRDQIEEAEAVFRKVLLVRVNNQTTTIDEQVAFVMTSVASWDRVEGKIVKLGFDDL